MSIPELGTCDSQHGNYQHTKCYECVNWRPVAAPELGTCNFYKHTFGPHEWLEGTCKDWRPVAAPEQASITVHSGEPSKRGYRFEWGQGGEQTAQRELFIVERSDGEWIDAEGNGGFSVWHTRAEAQDALDTEADSAEDATENYAVIRFARQPDSPEPPRSRHTTWTEAKRQMDEKELCQGSENNSTWAEPTTGIKSAALKASTFRGKSVNCMDNNPALSAGSCEWPPKGRLSCECCNALLMTGEFRDGLEIGETGVLPCGCAYCWHCDNNRGRAEEHDPNCAGIKSKEGQSDVESSNTVVDSNAGNVPLDTVDVAAAVAPLERSAHKFKAFADWAQSHYGPMMDYGDDSAEEVAVKYASSSNAQLAHALAAALEQLERAEKAEAELNEKVIVVRGLLQNNTELRTELREARTERDKLQDVARKSLAYFESCRITQPNMENIWYTHISQLKVALGAESLSGKQK